MATRADTDVESRRAAERTRYAGELEKVTGRRGLLDRTVRTAVRLATLVVGWRVVVDGLGDIPRDAAGRVVPCVVAAAPHRGWPDPFLVLLAWPRDAPRLAWFGDEVTMTRSWWRRRLLPRLGMIPIPARPSASAVHEHLDAARGVLSRGCCLVVFVEKGPPSPRGRTRAIAPGAAWLAGAGGVPIVPVALGGFLETGLGTRFRVRFLPPIAPPGGIDGPTSGPRASRNAPSPREGRVTTAALAAALAEPVAELEAWTFATNGRRPLPGLDAPLTAQGMVRTVRAAFPRLNQWLNSLPDPRVQQMCLYTAAHLWGHIIATFMALLELIKNRIVRAVQVEQFGAIRLMKAVTDEITPTSGDLFA